MLYTFILTVHYIHDYVPESNVAESKPAAVQPATPVVEGVAVDPEVQARQAQLEAELLALGM